MGAVQTSQAELEAFYAKALPGFYEYIRSHSTDVGAIEIATTLEGITTLPARQSLGGVDKTVLAPLTLLTADVDEAVDAANGAADKANAAAVEANAAATKVTDAITDISEEKQAALEAAASAGKAATAANTAADEADISRKSIEANETAREEAEQSRETAEQARVKESSDAVSACVKATTAANTAATSATTAANSASTAASNANSEASNLSALKTECADMTAAASAAAQSAGEKIEEMDSLIKNLAVETQSAPVKMVVDVLPDISVRNKVAQSITVTLYPTYVMQNVLFQVADGDSLRVNPSGLLTVKGEGTTVFYVIPTQNTQLWQEVSIKVRQPRMRLTSTGKIRLSDGKIRIV